VHRPALCVLGAAEARVDAWSVARAVSDVIV
jgi:hypothetical protein